MADGKPDIGAQLMRLNEWLDEGRIDRAQYDQLYRKITGQAPPDTNPAAPTENPKAARILAASGNGTTQGNISPKGKKGTGIGCLTAVAIGVFLIFAFGRESPEDKLARENREAAQKVEDTRKGFHCLSGWDGSFKPAVDKVKEGLREPDSFEHVETRVTPVNNGEHTFIMTYRAKNGFGGTNVEKVIGTYSNTGCRLLSIAQN